MKKLFLLIAAACASLTAAADEGMWLLPYLQKMNIKEMKARGCKLSAEEIYSVNKSSLKDAIVVDVGGTTTDLGVIQNGFPRESSVAVTIGGVRTNFRMPDVISIGLGGGSIVRVRDDGTASGAQLYMPMNRHNGSANYTMVDGHVERIRAGGIRNYHVSPNIR